MRTLVSRFCSSVVVLLLVAGQAQAAGNLADMSLEDLMNVTVTSATKRAQNRMDAAAAITVLTNEDIRRSGATSIPEALRMVPGLQVARIDAANWAISARGFNGQFSNKLLVLIDGRVVYTPLFGGVYWDVQDVMMGDIDRIEVIRGPGGTLWGANAVNGVINITTKSAKDTQGVLATGLAGNQEYLGDGRFGGMIGDKVAYRAYGRGFKRDSFVLPESALGYPPHDEWWQWRVGARTDSQLTEDDHLTVQGDFYQSEQEDSAYNLFGGTIDVFDDAKLKGGNVVTRWNHTLSETQSIEVQAIWDQTVRETDSSDETRNNFDLLFQHDFALGHDDDWLFNWGLEYFFTGDEVVPGVGTNFNSLNDKFNRVSGFMQAQWNLLDDDLQLIAGTKLEWNNYTDFEYQPTVRALYKVHEGNVLWAAVSRAVHSPTRVDRDINFGGLVNGNPDIESEHVISNEIGYRNYMIDRLTLDLSLFFNVYRDGIGLEGVTFENVTDTNTWGGEIEVAWMPIDQLRFVTSYAYLGIDEISASTSPFTDSSEGASPEHTWMLRGLWNLPWAPVELDSTVWYVSKLDSRYNPAFLPVTPGVTPTIPAYWRLDLRVAWQALDWLALEVAGQNLTDKSHVEWGEGNIPIFPGDYVPRSYYGKVTVEF